MKNLETVLKDVESHYRRNKRKTIVFVPPSIRTQAYAIWTKMSQGEPAWDLYDGHLSLAVAAESEGRAYFHYDTMYVINPQEISSELLESMKIVMTHGRNPLTICVNLSRDS
jgi:hypothetical protein